MINPLKQWKWTPEGEQRTASSVFTYQGEVAGTTYEMALAKGLQEPRVNRQLRRMADNIVREFPPDTGGTLLLAGVGTSSHTADVAAQLGRHLTTVQQGHVVLVDADAAHRVLSQRLAATRERGLAEAVRDALPASRFVLNTAIPRLRFMPHGMNGGAPNQVAKEAIADVIAELRQGYRYTIVAAGSEQHPLTFLLSRYCDGTYLVVQIGRADRSVTAGFARQLTEAGSRTLGCIATGVPPAVDVA